MTLEFEGVNDLRCEHCHALLGRLMNPAALASVLCPDCAPASFGGLPRYMQGDKVWIEQLRLENEPRRLIGTRVQTVEWTELDGVRYTLEGQSGQWAERRLYPSFGLA